MLRCCGSGAATAGALAASSLPAFGLAPCVRGFPPSHEHGEGVCRSTAGGACWGSEQENRCTSRSDSSQVHRGVQMIHQAGAEIWLEPRNPGQGSRASPFGCKLGRFIDHNYATDLRGYTLSAKCEGVPHRPSVKSASHMDEVCDDNTCGRAVDEHSDKCEVCSAHSPGPPMLGSCGDSPHLIGGSGGPRRVNGIANRRAPPPTRLQLTRYTSTDFLATLRWIT